MKKFILGLMLGVLVSWALQVIRVLDIFYWGCDLVIVSRVDVIVSVVTSATFILVFDLPRLRNQRRIG